MAEVLADKELEFRIQSFSLVPSDGGRFEFSVDDEVIFSKKQLGRHPEPGEIMRLFREHLGS